MCLNDKIPSGDKLNLIPLKIKVLIFSDIFLSLSHSYLLGINFIFLNIISNHLYIKNEIIDLIEKRYKAVGNKKKFKDQAELKNISFSKDSWFNIIDINLIKCEKELVLDYLEIILTEIVKSLRKVKGDDLCFKYFNEEGIYVYIYNNMKLLKDLNLDLFFLELFLLL